MNIPMTDPFVEELIADFGLPATEKFLNQLHNASVAVDGFEVFLLEYAQTNDFFFSPFENISLSIN